MDTRSCKQCRLLQETVRGISSSRKYAIANLAEKCQCEIFLDAFEEECIQDADVHSVACCDVCNMNPQLVNMAEEPSISFDAITAVYVGSKVY